MSKHIEKKGSTWFAVLYVPSELRQILGGRTKFAKSLETTDEKTAQLKAGAYVLEWKAAIEAARLGKASTSTTSITQVEAVKPEGVVMVPFTVMQDAFIYALGLRDGESKDNVVRRFNWLAARFKYIEELSQGVLVKKLLDDGVSLETASKTASLATRYVDYLRHRGAVGKDVQFNGRLTEFDRKLFPRPGSEKHSYIPWSPEEVARLYEGALEHKVQRKPAKVTLALPALIAIGAYSGLRLDEICSLTAKDCVNGVFNVRQSKSAAGVRKVPIHSELKPLVDALVAKARGGRLFKGVQSKSASSLFLRLRLKLGFGDYKQRCFHSLRKSLATALEQGGVPENVAADILGHEKPQITYGVYSGGASEAQKRSALELVRYPFTVDAHR